MKFGLILVPQVRKGEPEPFGELVEQIEFAEELGYESVWLTEHHFSEYGRAAVSALVGYAAARTSRIRISTAVVVLPFHHPIQVAEDWATLDHLSGGRVDVGIGRGSQPAEFAGFDVSMDEARERYQESLNIIKKAWTEESFSYDGQFWKIPEVEVLPACHFEPPEHRAIRRRPNASTRIVSRVRVSGQVVRAMESQRFQQSWRGLEPARACASIARLSLIAPSAM